LLEGLVLSRLEDQLARVLWVTRRMSLVP